MERECILLVSEVQIIKSLIVQFLDLSPIADLTCFETDALKKLEGFLLELKQQVQFFNERPFQTFLSAIPLTGKMKKFIHSTQLYQDSLEALIKNKILIDPPHTGTMDCSNIVEHGATCCVSKEGLYLVEAVCELSESKEETSQKKLQSQGRKKCCLNKKVRQCSKALKCDPEHHKVLHSLGCLKYKAGDVSAASRLLRKALLLAPTNPLLHHDLAVLRLTAFGDLVRAEAHLRAAVQANPLWDKPHLHLGYLLYRLKGDLPQAKHHFNQALKLDSQNFKTWLHLSQVQVSLDQWSQAYTSLKRAIALAPENSKVQIQLALFHVLDGQVIQAKESLKKAARNQISCRSARFFILLALLAIEEHFFRFAGKLLHRAMLMHPRNPLPFAMMGLISEKVLKITDTAEVFLREAVYLCPQSLMLHQTLGHIMNRKGDFHGAYQTYWKGLKSHCEYLLEKPCYENECILFCMATSLQILENDMLPGIFSLNAEAELRFFLSCNLQSMGKVLEAEHQIRDGIALSPMQGKYFLLLGAILLATKNLAEALSCCKKAVQLDPANADAHYYIGVLTAEDMEAKEYHLRQAIASQILGGHAYFELGFFFLDWKKDSTNARFCFKKAISLGICEAYLQLGKLLETATSNSTGAQSCYLAAVDTPSIARHLHVCAEAHLRLGHLFHRAFICQNLGLVEIGAEDADQCEFHYKEVLRYDSSNFEAHLWLGEFLLRHRMDGWKAQVHFKYLLKENFVNIHTYLEMARLHWDFKKDPSGTEKYFRSALAMDPNSMLANQCLAEFLLSCRKNIVGAEHLYKRTVSIHNSLLNASLCSKSSKVHPTLNSSKGFTCSLIQFDSTKYLIMSKIKLGQLFCQNGNIRCAEQNYKDVLILDPKNMEANFEYGVMLKENGDDVLAERLFLQCLLNNPFHCNSFMQLGCIMEKREDFTSAETYLNRGFQINPEDSHINYHIGRFWCLRGKNLVKAKRCLEKAANAGFRSCNLLCLLGNIYLLENDTVRAEKHVRVCLDMEPDFTLAEEILLKILSIQNDAHSELELTLRNNVRENPSNFDFLMQLGDFLCEKRRDFKGAKHYFTKVLNLSPSSATAHYKIAKSIEQYQKDYNLAKLHYLKAIEGDDAFADAYVALASLFHLSLGNPKSAETYYLLALETSTPLKAAIHAQLGLLLQDCKSRIRDAEEHFKQSLKLDTCNLAVHLDYAMFLQKYKADENAAKRQYWKALEISSENAKAHLQLAQLLHVTDPFSAKQHYSLALAQEPGNSMVHCNLASVLKKMKEYEQAGQELKIALELDPFNAHAHYSLGRLLHQKTRHFVAAEEHYQKALEIEPTHLNARFCLANLLLYSKHDVYGAEKHFCKILDKDPNNPKAHFALAKILERRGQVETAHHHYEECLRSNPSHVCVRKHLLQSALDRKWPPHRSMGYEIPPTSQNALRSHSSSSSNSADDENFPGTLSFDYQSRSPSLHFLDKKFWKAEKATWIERALDDDEEENIIKQSTEDKDLGQKHDSEVGKFSLDVEEESFGEENYLIAYHNEESSFDPKVKESNSELEVDSASSLHKKVLTSPTKHQTQKPSTSLSFPGADNNDSKANIYSNKVAISPTSPQYLFPPRRHRNIVSSLVSPKKEDLFSFVQGPV